MTSCTCCRWGGGGRAGGLAGWSGRCGRLGAMCVGESEVACAHRKYPSGRSLSSALSRSLSGHSRGHSSGHSRVHTRVTLRSLSGHSSGHSQVTLQVTLRQVTLECSDVHSNAQARPAQVCTRTGGGELEVGATLCAMQMSVPSLDGVPICMAHRLVSTRLHGSQAGVHTVHGPCALAWARHVTLRQVTTPSPQGPHACVWTGWRLPSWILTWPHPPQW